MASRDSVATALIDQMSEIERQRRMLMMHQKELDAKVSFATTEQEQLQSAVKGLQEEEAKLKQDLEVVATEQAQLEQQRMEAVNRLHRTQEETELFLSSTESDLQQLSKEKSAWIARAQDLESLRLAWGGNTVLSQCAADIREEEQRRTQLRSSSDSVRCKMTETEAAIVAVREKLQMRRTRAESVDISSTAAASSELAAHVLTPMAAEGSSGPSATAAEDTRIRLSEDMKKADYEFAQAEARHARIMGGLQREVEALSVRAEELDQLLFSIGVSRQEVQARTFDVQLCNQTGLCFRCISLQKKSPEQPVEKR